MPKEHKVKQGEDISSIAERYGISPEKIWDDPVNSELKEKRKNPNILHFEDVVIIPDKETKEESGVTATRHRFRRKGVPEKLQIQLLDEEDAPRSSVEYMIDIDGKHYHDLTDADGWIKRSIVPDAKRIKLTVIEEGIEEEYQINLGNLNPIELDIGIQQRLNNLGFDCGAEDGNIGKKTQMAMKEFQKKYHLKKTAIADDATRTKLEEIYGC